MRKLSRLAARRPRYWLGRGAVVASLMLVPVAGSAQAERRAPSRRPGVVTKLDTSQFRGLRYRMIGPARGGRVTTVTGVPQQPMTFYMGSTGGGVWKTTNGGHSWTNISDGFFEVASMGSMDVADSDPNVIYAGTGSGGTSQQRFHRQGDLQVHRRWAHLVARGTA